MEWQEITVFTVPEAIEAVAECFYQVGAVGVVIEDPELLKARINDGSWDAFELPEEMLKRFSPVVKGYLPVNEILPAKLEELKIGITEVMARLAKEPGEISLARVEEEDWANSWKAYFKPLHLTEKIVIKPTWEAYQSQEGELVVEMDPGMAFGTGTHITTALCAAITEKYLQPGMKVYDVGTGTGILAMMAALLGAAEVLALDYDPVAVGVAEQNVRHNGLEQVVQVKQNDLLAGIECEADFIVANIIADIIIKLFPQVKNRLKRQGVFIASGIIAERREEVLTAAQTAGFQLVEEQIKEDWVVQVWQFKK